MNKVSWALVVTAVSFAILGFILGYDYHKNYAEPFIRVVEVPVEKIIEVEVPVDRIVYQDREVPVSMNMTALDEAIEIVEKAKESHVLIKGGFQTGLYQPNELTGGIDFQDWVIARYDKVLAFLENLKNTK